MTKHVFLFVLKIAISYGVDLHAEHEILRADFTDFQHDITQRNTGLRYTTGQH